MANEEHLKILQQGVEAWNAWRAANPDEDPDLGEANLEGADLSGADLNAAWLSGARLCWANLSGANLCEANLNGTDLREAGLSGANLCEATLTEAWLSFADLDGADLSGADLSGASLREASLCWAILRGADMTGAVLSSANLQGADLSSADLSHASLVDTKVTQTANLSGCRIYGVSTWGVELDATTKQAGLVITKSYEPEVTVDSLEVAGFIYLLLQNESIRHVIDTITSKVVLILGRFTDERKVVLDAIREELRKGEYDYVPVVFDFDKPTSQTTRETVTTMAGMARFVIADLTDAKSVLLELEAIVPKRTSLPVRPILLASQQQPGMLDSLEPYPWFLPVHSYETAEGLIEALPEVIAPAEAKALEIRERMEPSF